MTVRPEMKTSRSDARCVTPSGGGRVEALGKGGLIDVQVKAQRTPGAGPFFDDALITHRLKVATGPGTDCFDVVAETRAASRAQLAGVVSRASG
jgi:hypothetical protein